MFQPVGWFSDGLVQPVMMMTTTMMTIMMMTTMMTTMMATIVVRVSLVAVADWAEALILRLMFGGLRKNGCKVQLVQPELAQLGQPVDGVPYGFFFGGGIFASESRAFTISVMSLLSFQSASQLWMASSSWARERKPFPLTSM